MNLTAFEPLQARAPLDPGDLSQHRRLRGVGAAAQGQAERGTDHRAGEGLGAARPRRRRLSDRHQVELHAAQLRRCRSTWCATRTRASRAPATTATSCATTRTRSSRDWRSAATPPTRRWPTTTSAASSSASRCRASRRRSPRPTPPASSAEHPQLRHRLRPVHLRRRRRLHLRRGDGTPGVARGQARQAALQAAVPGQLRPVRRAHHDQQHAELRLGADDPAQGTGVVRRARTAELRRHADLLGVGARSQTAEPRAAARHAVRGPARAVRRGARRSQAEGSDSRRRLGAGGAGRDHAAHQHGLRLGEGRRLRPRHRRRHRHGRDHLHGAGARAHLALLHVRVLRPVHAVPRGHRLDEPPAEARARRRGAARGARDCCSTSPTISRGTRSARSATPRRGRCRASSSTTATSSST